MAWVPHCCGSGVGRQLKFQFKPLAWEIPYAAGVALKRQRKKEKERKRKKERKKERKNPTRSHMRMWVQSLAPLSGLRIQRCGIGHRHGWDGKLLWLWCRPQLRL